MKIFTIVAICILSAISAFSQNRLPLNEKLSETFKRNFSEWQTANADKSFYPMIKHTWKFNPQIHKADEVTDLESIWTKEGRRVQISMDLATDDESEFAMRIFTIRNISPPSYKIDDLGNEAVLVKFYNRVEIAFTKENIVTYIYSYYPSKYKKLPGYYSQKMYAAPHAEVEFVLKIARLIAAEIKGKQTIESFTGVKQ